MIKAALHIDHDAGGNRGKGLSLAGEYIEQLRVVDPQAAIVVIATARGVGELVETSETAYPDLGPWHGMGVQFVCCAYSVHRHGVGAKLLQGVQTVPVGLAYLLELVSQGYTLLKVTSYGQH